MRVILGSEDLEADPGEIGVDRANKCGVSKWAMMATDMLPKLAVATGVTINRTITHPLSQ